MRRETRERFVNRTVMPQMYVGHPALISPSRRDGGVVGLVQVPDRVGEVDKEV
jgi:hypothetical protein